MFRVPENKTGGYSQFMTGPALKSSEVLIAGVPWPRHKLYAIVAGFIALLLVGALTTSAAPAVLGGTAVAIVVAVAVRAVDYRRG